MNLDAWHAFSLRRTLLLALFPGLLLVVGAEIWHSWRSANEAANAAYDRSLLGAIKSIDANISTASGGLGVELPYRMLEFFELTASGRVYYRVATEDGLVEIGNADLPPPPRVLTTGKPHFSEVRYFDEAVRLGSYARVLDPPLAGATGSQRVVIQVAETLESRHLFTRSLVLQSLRGDLLLVLAASTLLALAVNWALRPLTRLRSDMLARAPSDLAPISPVGIPADVRPLVETINFHMARNHSQTEAQRRFVDDASHQMRTPLTTLTTQLGFALRETDPHAQRQALLALKSQLEETVRQTNQMLALARADSSDISTEATDVNELVRKLTQKCWSEARAHGLDLGLESEEEPLMILAQPSVLGEAVLNLLHNAIRYTPSGGQITVRTAREAGHAAITVVDDGPGMPADELARAGERFFRGSQVQKPGTGLGLAIVKSIVERHDGTLHIGPGPGARGLQATLYIPLIKAP